MSKKAQSPKLKSRILVVDDHPIICDGVKFLCRKTRDLEVCGTASNGPEALKAIDELDPHLALVDITLPGRSGIDLIKDIRRLFKALPVLVFSVHDEGKYAKRAFRAGARGYLQKTRLTEELRKAVRRVIAGERYLSPDLQCEYFDLIFSSAEVETKLRARALSDREMEVLEKIAIGQPRKAVAAELHVSKKTIETHVRRIKSKLGIKPNADLAECAKIWEGP